VGCKNVIRSGIVCLALVLERDINRLWTVHESALCLEVFWFFVLCFLYIVEGGFLYSFLLS